eukprot:g22578.t1
MVAPPESVTTVHVNSLSLSMFRTLVLVMPHTTSAHRSQSVEALHPLPDHGLPKQHSQSTEKLHGLADQHSQSTEELHGFPASSSFDSLQSTSNQPAEEKDKRTHARSKLGRLTRLRSIDYLLNAFITLGCVFGLIYITPYEFIVKQKLASLLKRKGSVLIGWARPVSLVFFAIMCTELQRQARRRRFWNKLQHRTQQRSGSSADPDAQSQTKVCVTLREARLALESVRRLHKSFMVFVLLWFARRALELLQMSSIQQLIASEQEELIKAMVNFQPPSLRALDLTIAAYRRFFSPVFLGWENIPGEMPLLFVSNHSIMGFDFPLILYELYRRKGIYVRALADHAHFQIPLNAQVMRNLGAVDGNRANCARLFQAKQACYVYPGGAREVFKRTTDDKYALMWENRLGFASVAVEHGVTIVPVVNYGTEDWLEVVADLPMGWLPIPFLWGSDRTLPFALPQPGQLKHVFFKFCTPIRTDRPEWKERQNDPDVLCQVRDLTQQAIEEGLQQLK